MALIPPDVGIRMRMQTEANLLQPVAPAHEIPSDLPELRPGQTFSARIQEALPDNTYKALVAGKQLTLQLPEGDKTGDELLLVVIDRSAKAIIAKQVETGGKIAGEASEAYPFAKFSPAARMIGQLLPAEGEKPAPAALNRGQPLLAQPPQSQNAAAQLAPNLAKAVTQSGMFYEAHQAQWVAGKLPLEQLLQEPQGQRSGSLAFQVAAAEVAARAISTPERPITANTILQALQANTASQTQPLSEGTPTSPVPRDTLEVVARAISTPERPVTANTLLQILQTGNEKVGAGETASHAAQPPQTASLTHQVADELRPLVQQQLEASATNRMVWHGEVWPRQTMNWEIEWQGEREADGSEDEGMRWSTTLSLTTPRLGRVDAQLRLSSAGVTIVLATPYGASAADLRDESPALCAALEAAGVPLLGFQVRHEEPTAPEET